MVNSWNSFALKIISKAELSLLYLLHFHQTLFIHSEFVFFFRNFFSSFSFFFLFASISHELYYIYYIPHMKMRFTLWTILFRIYFSIGKFFRTIFFFLFFGFFFVVLFHSISFLSFSGEINVFTWMPASSRALIILHILFTSFLFRFHIVQRASTKRKKNCETRIVPQARNFELWILNIVSYTIWINNMIYFNMNFVYEVFFYIFYE